jgi:hypothetical protein
MARKKDDDHIRTITKVAGGKSYCITLPIKIVREMKWESQQKVLVKRRGNKIIIQDHVDGVPIADTNHTPSSDSFTFEIDGADIKSALLKEQKPVKKKRSKKG